MLKKKKQALIQAKKIIKMCRNPNCVWVNIYLSRQLWESVENNVLSHTWKTGMTCALQSTSCSTNKALFSTPRLSELQTYCFSFHAENFSSTFSSSQQLFASVSDNVIFLLHLQGYQPNHLMRNLSLISPPVLNVLMSKSKLNNSNG